MKNHYRELKCSVLIAITCFSASAQDSVDQMRSLYSRLSDLIAVDVGSLNRSGTHLILAPSGGFLLDPTLDPDNNLNDRRVLIGNFMDVRIAESWVLSMRKDPMSWIYRSALVDSVTPNFSLTPAEQTQYENLDRQLYNSRREPTRRLRLYYEAEDALVAAMSSVLTFQQANVGVPVPPDRILDLRRATAKYNVQAQGVSVKEELRKHVELQRKRSSAWLSDLKDIFDANYNTQWSLGNVDYYPSYKVWIDPKTSFTPIKSTQKDFEQQTHNSSTSYGGGLSGGWGMFRVGGSYERDEKLHFQQSKATNMVLSFDVMLVPIRYPWMITGLFESKAWDWSGSAQYAGTLISDGKFNPGELDRKEEVLPLIPTMLIVAKNVRLSADWSFNMNEFKSVRESGKASFGWGPFSLGGRYSKSDEKSYVVAKLNGTELNFDSPQIIGYFAYMPSKSPERDPNLPWDSDTLRLSSTTPTSDAVLNKANDLLKRLDR